MSHRPYKLSDKEVETLMAAMLSKSKEEVYGRMKDKAIGNLDRKQDLDEDFLDMSETILKRARELSTSDTEIIVVRDAYYSLHYMLRKLAHELNMTKIKNGSPPDNNRFIRLVSYNKNAPSVY